MSSLAIHRHPAFLRNYRFLPHRLLNQTMAQITRARRPSWAVQGMISAWSRIERIELDDFEARHYVSLDDFFLRRLRPGARPLGGGFVAPADGKLVASGILDRDTKLWVKGQQLSADRIVNAGIYDLDLEKYLGGTFAVIFLTPRGYHYVHMPAAGKVRDVRWIPGRFFPQNETALSHIPGVYERNERAVLRCTTEKGNPYLLVMVGASLIGGIHLDARPRDSWARPGTVAIEQGYAKGERIGHFSFGSTVVVFTPRGFGRLITTRSEVRMGESLLDAAVD